MAGAAEETADALAGILTVDEADALTQCEQCHLMKADCELVMTYMGEILACGECRDYDPFLEYKTRVYRGLEDW